MSLWRILISWIIVRIEVMVYIPTHILRILLLKSKLPFIFDYLFIIAGRQRASLDVLKCLGRCQSVRLVFFLPYKTAESCARIYHKLSEDPLHFKSCFLCAMQRSASGNTSLKSLWACWISCLILLILANMSAVRWCLLYLVPCKERAEFFTAILEFHWLLKPVQLVFQLS